MSIVAKQFIDRMSTEPVFDIQVFSKSLYTTIAPLAEMRVCFSLQFACVLT